MNLSSAEKETITIRELLLLFSRSWKLLAIGILIGGTAGLAASKFLPPVYEAVAVYDFSIDFSRTGLLTDIEVDQALEIAGDIIKSSPVLQNTLITAGENGITISDSDSRSVFQAERRFNQWLLKVHWKDPSDAAKLANLWAESARTVLLNSELASLNADFLQRHILSLESCLQQSTSGLPAQPLCRVSNRTELQMELETSGKDLLAWRGKSNGLFPGLNFTWSQDAQIPSRPIQQSQGSLTLSGGLAGLFAAAMISLFIERKPA